MEEKYTVLVVDDNADAAASTCRAVSQFVPEEEILCIHTAGQAIDWIDRYRFRIVFLDVELSDTTGFAIAEYIESHNKDLPYVFLTGHSRYAYESYNYEPLDFLTKPIDYMRLRKTFGKLEKPAQEKAIEKIAFSTEDGFALFPVNELLYVEKKLRKNMLYTVHGKAYPINHSMNEIELMLDGYGFFRCHQSFLVNIGNIQEVKAAERGTTYIATMTGDVTLPVSRSKYPLLKEKLQKAAMVYM